MFWHWFFDLVDVNGRAGEYFNEETVFLLGYLFLICLVSIWP